MKFKVNNINCINCANTIKAELQDTYGKIDINVEQKELSIDLAPQELENFRSDLAELGFEIAYEIK